MTTEERSIHWHNDKQKLESRLKNYQLFRLPQRDIPVFHGDPLEYRSLMRACVVLSWPVYQSWATGRRADSIPLQIETREKYGNELEIVIQAFNMLQIKAEDRKAWIAFSLFLVGWCNVMAAIDYIEMNNPSHHFKVVVQNERMMDSSGWRRARFTELVSFADRQAQIMSDPLFWDLNNTATIEKRDTNKGEQGKESM